MACVQKKGLIPMKIALFVETYLPYINGVVTHVKSLKDGLEQAGHTVLVVTAGADTLRHYIDEEQGILWCPAREFKRFYSYGIALPVSRTRRSLIKKFKPDIIHIHTEFGVGFSGLQIAKGLRIPVVYTMHTMYDDYLYYIAPKRLIPVAKIMTHRYFRYFGNNAAAITGPSAKVQNFMQQCGVVKEVNVVPNPVELDKFAPSCVDPAKVETLKAHYGITPEQFVICFCGRLGREKSIDVLLDDLAKTLDRRDQIRLLIFGDGPCYHELVSLSQSLGIDDVVTFAGKVPHEELIHHYACCDLYLTTSLSDTNSISMLEAMATGLPVAHRYDPLNAGQVRPGVNGFIFKDADEMYEAILTCKRYTPEQRQTLRASVIASVQQSGQDALAGYLLDVYTHLEQKAPPTSPKLGLRHKISVYEMNPFRRRKK